MPSRKTPLIPAFIAAAFLLTPLPTLAQDANDYLDDGACKNEPCLRQNPPEIQCYWNPKAVWLPTASYCGRIGKTGTPKFGIFDCGRVANAARTQCVEHCIFVKCVVGKP